MPILPTEQESLRAELMEITAEIEHRLKVNPLSAFNHLPLQKLFAEAEACIKALFGGNRSGKTEEGRELRVPSRGMSGEKCTCAV